MTPPPVVRITEWRMRWLFRKHNIWKKVKQRELTQSIVRSKDCIPEAGQKPGTKSQIIHYLDSNNLMVAVVHQYTNSDQSIGASKMPDPKELMINGIAFHKPRGHDKGSIFQRIDAVYLKYALRLVYFIDTHIGYIHFTQ